MLKRLNMHEKDKLFFSYNWRLKKFLKAQRKLSVHFYVKKDGFILKRYSPKSAGIQA